MPPELPNGADTVAFSNTSRASGVSVDQLTTLGSLICEPQQPQACLRVLHAAFQQLQVGEVLMSAGALRSPWCRLGSCRTRRSSPHRSSALVGHVHGHACCTGQMTPRLGGDLGLQQADACSRTMRSFFMAWKREIFSRVYGSL